MKTIHGGYLGVKDNLAGLKSVMSIADQMRGVFEAADPLGRYVKQYDPVYRFNMQYAESCRRLNEISSLGVSAKLGLGVATSNILGPASNLHAFLEGSVSSFVRSSLVSAQFSVPVSASLGHSLYVSTLDSNFLGLGATVSSLFSSFEKFGKYSDSLFDQGYSPSWGVSDEQDKVLVDEIAIELDEIGKDLGVSSPDGLNFFFERAYEYVCSLLLTRKKQIALWLLNHLFAALVACVVTSCWNGGFDGRDLKAVRAFFEKFVENRNEYYFVRKNTSAVSKSSAEVGRSGRLGVGFIVRELDRNRKMVLVDCVGTDQKNIRGWVQKKYLTSVVSSKRKKVEANCHVARETY